MKTLFPIPDRTARVESEDPERAQFLEQGGVAGKNAEAQLLAAKARLAARAQVSPEPRAQPRAAAPEVQAATSEPSSGELLQDLGLTQEPAPAQPQTAPPVPPQQWLGASEVFDPETRAAPLTEQEESAIRAPPLEYANKLPPGSKFELGEFLKAPVPKRLPLPYRPPPAATISAPVEMGVARGADATGEGPAKQRRPMATISAPAETGVAREAERSEAAGEGPRLKPDGTTGPPDPRPTNLPRNRWHRPDRVNPNARSPRTLRKTCSRMCTWEVTGPPLQPNKGRKPIRPSWLGSGSWMPSSST